MTDSEANTAPEVDEKPKTAQDFYASFIGKQAKRNSLFDTRDTKPVTAKDIGQSTGKINK